MKKDRLSKRDFLRVFPLVVAGTALGAKKLTDKLSLHENVPYFEWQPVTGSGLTKLLEMARDPNQDWVRRVDDPAILKRSPYYTYDQIIMAVSTPENGNVVLSTQVPRKEKYTFIETVNQDGDPAFVGFDSTGTDIAINLNPYVIKGAIERFSGLGKVEFLLNLQAFVKENEWLDVYKIPKHISYGMIKNSSIFLLTPLRFTQPSPDFGFPKPSLYDISATDPDNRPHFKELVYIVGVTYPDGKEDFFSPAYLSGVNPVLSG